MKKVILFLIFILYATLIFFIPEPIYLWGILGINLLAMLLFGVSIKEVIQGIMKVLPFIILTFAINWILSNYTYAIIISIKLLLVTHITLVYAKTTTIRGVALTIKKLCTPLKWLKINPEEIELMVCISLSMIPILKKEWNQLKEACIAKGIAIKVQNMKIILTKWMISIMKRVNEIEESIIEKGYE